MGNKNLLYVSDITHLILKEMSWESKTPVKKIVELAVVKHAISGTLWGLHKVVQKAYASTLNYATNHSDKHLPETDEQKTARLDEYFLDLLKKGVRKWRSEF